MKKTVVNEKMYALGAKSSVIREIFEYGNKRRVEIGAENVYDFSLGNPSVAPPQEVTDALIAMLTEREPTALHGYTSAAGAVPVRAAVADYIKTTFDFPADPNLIYMTVGAAAAAVSIAREEEAAILPKARCFQSRSSIA